MFKPLRLEDLIREKVPLGTADVRGFYSHKCQLCNDYKVRAGFKFEDNSVGFNCWNCATTGRYEEFSGRISRNMRKILHAYGIEDSEISQVVNSTHFGKKEEEPKKLTLSSLKKVSTVTPKIKLPPQSMQIGHPEFLDIQEPLVKYLDERAVDLAKYSFYFSLNERFKNRVIIPFYRNGDLIYWQARSIDPTEKKRYDNAVISRDAVMFNMDQLNKYSPLPLFVSEGVFDAMMFDGIATLGSKLTEAKIELLAGTRRRLVFVIDKDKNGRHFAEAVLKAGWEITFVPEGADDLNTSVRRFGRAWTAQQLIKNIPKTMDEAELALEINCR